MTLHRLTDTERAKWSTRPEALADRIRKGDVACDCGCGQPASIPSVTGLNGTSTAYTADCWLREWRAGAANRAARAKDILRAALANA